MKKLFTLLLAALMSFTLVGCASTKDVENLDLYERVVYQLMDDKISQYDVSRFKLEKSTKELSNLENDGVKGKLVKFTGSVSSTEMVWTNKIVVHYWLSADKKTYRPLYMKFDKNTLLSKEAGKKDKKVYKVSDLTF